MSSEVIPKPKEALPEKRGRSSWFKQGLKFLSSLQLTVVLLALAIVLVFVGTLVQVEKGIWTVVREYFHSLIAWVDLRLFFPPSWNVPGRIPIPGGWLVGGLLFINLVVAHIVRFQISWRRSALLLIHSGVLLLFLGEFFTAVFANEGNMSINEGGSSSYTEDIRHPELAVVDRSDSQMDNVVVIPDSLLKKQHLLQHEYLPFDIKVDRYMVNSVIKKDASAGFVAQQVPEVSGAQASNQVDMAAATVTFLEKGSTKELGSYLVSLWLDQPQQVVRGQKTYDITLRFKRYYRPYSLHLLDFRFDRYMGTDIPKNFSSTIRLVDPERGVDREVNIWMNHPLRYRGETFYQASYKPDESGTVLQVVKNPGWLLPYISCAMVGLGLILHFCMGLSRFLKHRRLKSEAA